MKIKLAVLFGVLVTLLAILAGTSSANGTDHPTCANRVEVNVNGPSYTVPAPPQGWVWIGVWSKSANGFHIQQSHAVGATFTSGEFNQNGQEQNISHVDLCKARPPADSTTTTTSTTTSTTTTTTTLPGSTTTTECEDCVPNTNVQTTTTTTPGSTTTTQPGSTTSSTEPGESSSTTSSTSTPTTTAPDGPTTTRDEPTPPIDPPDPLDPPARRVPGNLPETGADTFVMVGLGALAIIAGLIMLAMLSWRKADEDRGETWFGN